MWYVIGCVILYILYILFKLELYAVILLAVFGLIMIPFHKKLMQKQKKHTERFYEVSLYLDALFYAFMKEEKVQPAIRDVRDTLPKGRLKELVQEVLDYLNMTFDEVEVLQEGLGRIEKEYPCKRVQNAHKFMTHVEFYGGDITKPIHLLAEDKKHWVRRMEEHIHACKKQFTDITLSVVASLAICASILYLPLPGMELSRSPVSQIATVVVIVGCDLLLLWGQTFLAQDWLAVQLSKEADDYAKKMERYRKYDEKKEKRLSVLLGSVAAVLTGTCFFMGHKWLTIGFLVLTLVLFYQHRIGRLLLKRSLTTEIRYAFPNWLLDLVLLLQSENVYVSLRKSREFIPAVLRQDLRVLTDELELEPESSEPYHRFLYGFDIPEIHSAMGTLYALSIGNLSNADRQMAELVERNMVMLDLTERDMLRKSLGNMYLLFLLPVLLASMKLVVDLILLMMQFVSQMEI